MHTHTCIVVLVLLQNSYLLSVAINQSQSGPECVRSLYITEKERFYRETDNDYHRTLKVYGITTQKDYDNS